MKAQPFVVTPKDYDPALNVLGIKVTVLASNTATQAYEITRQQGEAGMGPPPHSHNWDESFYTPHDSLFHDSESISLKAFPLQDLRLANSSMEENTNDVKP
jgi:hypothetical protein